MELSLKEEKSFGMKTAAAIKRWRAGDEIELRKVYTKNGVSKPNERKHMMIVVILLHITCFAQYILCGLYWFYTITTRPDWALNLSIGISIAAPIIFVLYTRYGPLHRTNEEDEEVQKSEEFKQGIIVKSPEWIGGLFDCMEENIVSCLSFFCTFCVFGWNMERLGFGNKFVHIITFTVVCISPIFIFYITSLKVTDDKIKLILVIIGSILCAFGLLYGGFWRTKMRKKFKLPGNSFCCGSSTITDYIQWLFCWPCSLAQEVRTANFYDIEKDGFYEKVMKDGGRPVLILIPLESGGNKSFLRDSECSYENNILFGLPNKQNKYSVKFKKGGRWLAVVTYGRLSWWPTSGTMGGWRWWWQAARKVAKGWPQRLPACAMASGGGWQWWPPVAKKAYLWCKVFSLKIVRAFLS
ncbi:hypothetical protein IEQ34_016319 [Dendrobium chrysotoxum]|uniref:Uncharacterized protein n=1 Tax=Dendrobium chrysotoxum TaxID=161865 RepID=A0AAV7FXC0_DENCH|nr:hypothetical protein IEQ34_016319 [Dendrobium chrysotoxum]